jgi:cell shape-determining protein MreC
VLNLYWKKKRKKRILFIGTISIVCIAVIGIAVFLNKEQIMNYYEETTDVLRTYKENKELKSITTEAAIQNIKIGQLQYENQELARAFQATKQLSSLYSYSTSRITNATSTTLEIDLGDLDGIKKDYPVLSLDQYFIGVITETKDHSSTVQLINSKEFLMNNGISVTVKGEKKSFGIFEYDLVKKRPLINIISENDPMQVNGIIETLGGSASKYPQGLKVGKISNIDIGDMGTTRQAIVDIPEFKTLNELYVLIIRK